MISSQQCSHWCNVTSKQTYICNKERQMIEAQMLDTAAKKLAKY